MSVGEKWEGRRGLWVDGGGTRWFVIVEARSGRLYLNTPGGVFMKAHDVKRLVSLLQAHLAEDDHGPE